MSQQIRKLWFYITEIVRLPRMFNNKIHQIQSLHNYNQQGIKNGDFIIVY